MKYTRSLHCLTPPTGAPDEVVKQKTVHLENLSTSTSYYQKWKLSRKGDGDTALALFENSDQVREPIDPEVERRLVRRID
jgi:hypothetical protein